MLHFAQPRNPAEELTKTVIQQMNRKNRKGFMKFITDSGLQHLVLWTDAATIVTHFKPAPTILMSANLFFLISLTPTRLDRIVVSDYFSLAPTH